jgi:hypothetical protein
MPRARVSGRLPRSLCKSHAHTCAMQLPRAGRARPFYICGKSLRPRWRRTGGNGKSTEQQCRFGRCSCPSPEVCRATLIDRPTLSSRSSSTASAPGLDASSRSFYLGRSTPCYLILIIRHCMALLYTHTVVFSKRACALCSVRSPAP